MKQIENINDCVSDAQKEQSKFSKKILFSTVPIMIAGLIATHVNAPLSSDGISCYGEGKYRANLEALVRKKDIFLGDEESTDGTDHSMFFLANLQSVKNSFEQVKYNIKKRKGADTKEIFEELDKLYNHINSLNIPVANLQAALTKNNSIFLSFATIGSDFEFIVERFLDPLEKDDEQDFQGTLHVYNLDKEFGAYYGSMQYLFKIIYENIYAFQRKAITC